MSFTSNRFLPPKPPKDDTITYVLWNWLTKAYRYFVGASNPTGITTSASVNAESDYFYPIDTTAADAVFHLPTAKDSKGKPYLVIKTDSSAHKIILTPVSGDTINGLSTLNVTIQNQIVEVYSDGVNTWYPKFNSNATGGPAAPFDAQYVVMALSPNLSQERVLTQGTGITITDGGANGAVTISATGGGGGTGTVTSVAQTVPVEFVISGSPIIAAGTLAITKATQLAHTFWAGPLSGAAAVPTFRVVDNTDLPFNWGKYIAGRSVWPMG